METTKTKPIESIYRTGEIRTQKDVKETRKVQFVISDDSKDRYGTVVNMDNWNLDNFNRNGIVGYQHDVYGGGLCSGPDPDSVIGTGRAWIEEDTRNNASSRVLIGEVEFEPKEINPLAEKVFQKVLHGTLKATSVGFRPLKDENGNKGTHGRINNEGKRVDEDTFFYHGQELLEFSIVNIPANPNALKRELRSQTANALHFVKRQLGAGWTYGEIEKMKVGDVIKMLENGETEKPKNLSTTFTLDLKDIADRFDVPRLKKEESNEQPDYGLRKLTIRKRKIQNKKAII